MDSACQNFCLELGGPPDAGCVLCGWPRDDHRFRFEPFEQDAELVGRPEWAESVSDLVEPHEWKLYEGDWIANVDDAVLGFFVTWKIVSSLEVYLTVGDLDLRTDVVYSEYRDEMLRLRNAVEGYEKEL